MENVSLRDYVDQRFNDSDKAIQAALAAQEKAVLKAEVAAEERFKLLNELRSGVATVDQLDALEKLHNALKERMDRQEGKGLGLHSGWGYVIGFVGLVSIIYNLVK